MKHTATPWKQHKGQWGIHNIEDSKEGQLLCEVQGSDSEANAAFIVKACNAHEDLLRLLKLSLEDLEDYGTYSVDILEIKRAIANAEQG